MSLKNINEDGNLRHIHTSSLSGNLLMGKKSLLYSTTKSLNPAICASDGHFQKRWVFCSLKNISSKRYMSDYSLSVKSHVWYKINLTSETSKISLYSVRPT